MKRVIDRPQMSDMGSGFGHIEVPAETTLKDALNWIRKNTKAWGLITIYRNSDDIIRCFDYDLYSNTIFYHNLSTWQYDSIVKKIEFSYCFMSEDIDIYVK